MIVSSSREDFSSLETAILMSVVYADVFDYPLTAVQIHRYLPGILVSEEGIESALKDSRLTPGLVVQSGEYFTLPGRELLVEIRKRREQNARQLWRKALAYGRLIARLPFVRMLAVTGSLTMNNVDESDDIDFLIVTSTGRLWTCRAFVIGVVRLAGLGGFNLCPNYLVSEDALEFTDRSLYTAHELAQMVLLSGEAAYNRLRLANQWVTDFLPNAGSAPNFPGGTIAELIPLKINKMLESVFASKMGDWFERWESQRKIRKFSILENPTSEVCFSSDVCKGHFQRHGQKTSHILRQKLGEFSEISELSEISKGLVNEFPAQLAELPNEITKEAVV